MSVTVEKTEKENLLIVRASGKLTGDDYSHFVPTVEELIKEHGKIRLLFEMRDFHGWTVSALWQDTKFDVKHFRDIEKLALVGDKKWEQWMSKFCEPFTTARIEYFDISEEEKALAWVKSD